MSDGTVTRRGAGTTVVLRSFFRDHGWALALHGSCVRDLDFIAVPWIEQHPTTVGGLVIGVAEEFVRYAEGPTWKPHGRIAYAFHPREWHTSTNVLEHAVAARPRTWDVSFVDPRNAITRGFAVSDG